MNVTVETVSLVTADSPYIVPGMVWYALFFVAIAAIIISEIMDDRPIIPLLIALITSSLAAGLAPWARIIEVHAFDSLDTACVIQTYYPAVPVWLWYTSMGLVLMTILLLFAGAWVVATGQKRGGMWG